MINKDVAIIGGGPSGITATIYLKRAGIDFVLFEEYMIGGKVNLTANVDNYPPYTHIGGVDLANKYQEDLNFNQIEVTYEKVISLEKINDGSFKLVSDSETYNFKAVLVCSGCTNKTLSAINENKFIHKGISFCAVCDGNLFKNKPMAVIGGGNSALEEAIYLSAIASKVYLIHRRDEFRANKQYVDILKSQANVEMLLSYNLLECKGDTKLRQIVLKSVKDDSILTLDVEALFEYVGLIPNTDFILNKDILDEKGFIKVDNLLHTSIEGLFASGDVSNKPLRQIVVASGDGALASNEIINYLNLIKK